MKRLRILVNLISIPWATYFVAHALLHAPQTYLHRILMCVLVGIWGFDMWMGELMELL